MTAPILYIDTPLMTISMYAEKIGVSVFSVKSKIAKGHIPTVKQGKNRLVNYALICRQCWEAEQ